MSLVPLYLHITQPVVGIQIPDIRLSVLNSEAVMQMATCWRHDVLWTRSLFAESVSCLAKKLYDCRPDDRLRTDCASSKATQQVTAWRESARCTPGQGFCWFSIYYTAELARVKWPDNISHMGVDFYSTLGDH